MAGFSLLIMKNHIQRKSNIRHCRTIIATSTIIVANRSQRTLHATGPRLKISRQSANHLGVEWLTSRSSAPCAEFETVWDRILYQNPNPEKRVER